MRPLLLFCRLAAVVAAGLAAGVAAPAGAHAPNDAATKALLFDDARAFAYSQQAIGRTLGPHALVDHEGRAFRLHELRGKPLVVSLIYTSCYHTCPLIVENLERAVRVARQTLGRDSFTVLTVGFDSANDTPQRMRAYARGHGIALDNWLFASADAATIAALADELGFIYIVSPRGFDHLAQTTVVSTEGRVYRHVYGDDFTAPAVVEPLRQLVLGERIEFANLSALVERVKLLCTIYDPKSGRYRFSYAIFVGLIIGATSLVGVGAFVVRAWLQTRAT
jgi:protein SCO1/2